MVRPLPARQSQTSTGPAFEWIDQDAKWHSSAGLPAEARPARSPARARAPCRSCPASTRPPACSSRPSPTPLPDQGRDPGQGRRGRRRRRRSSSSPTRRLGATTTRTDGITHVYGQIVDADRNVVVGNQATPIPIELDGAEHTISTRLTRIASDATEAGYELQLVGQSDLFDAQRAAGAVTVSDLSVSLPKTRGTLAEPALGLVGALGEAADDLRRTPRRLGLGLAVLARRVAGVDALEDDRQLPVAERDEEVDLREVAAGALGVARRAARRGSGSPGAVVGGSNSGISSSPGSDQ